MKYHNATLYITGDDWQSEKFDKCRSSVTITDTTTSGAQRPGRVEHGPSVQLFHVLSASAWSLSR